MICPEHSFCKNQYGGYMCACNDGYKRDGKRCIGRNLFEIVRNNSRRLQNYIFKKFELWKFELGTVNYNNDFWDVRFILLFEFIYIEFT